MANRNSKNLNHRSIFKKFSASLTALLFLASTNLTTAALANDQGGRGASLKAFELANPGLERQELKQMFKDHWQDVRENLGNNAAENAAATVNNAVNNSVSSINASVGNQLNVSDFANKAEFKAYRDALRSRSSAQNINQSIQQSETNKIVKVNSGFSLDLSSTIESITLGNNLFKEQTSVAITVGGETKTVQAGSKVTAAEYVAAKQALIGSQSVHVDAEGRATGGSVDLSALTTGNHNMRVEDLVVPVAVTASGDFGKGGDVRIQGDLLNSGSIVAYSSDNNVKNAGIFADNITNAQTGNITSQLNEVARNNGGVVSDLNLTLQANDTLANYGSISSGGDLTLGGGTAVYNLGSGASATAANSVNIQAPVVGNQGAIAAGAGNVNITAPLASDLFIAGHGGSVQALNGEINIGTPGQIEKIDTTVFGGDWAAKEVNLHSGDGHVLVTANSIDAPVNAKAGSGVIGVTSGDMTTGEMTFSGDPIIFATSGSVNLTNQFAAGAPITILASLNIQGTATHIISENISGAGGDITLVAGASLSTGTPGQVRVLGAGLNPGDITLSSLQFLDSRGSTNGGNIDLITYGGNVTLPSFITITTGGGGTGTNGNVNIISGATSGLSINAPNIDTRGGSGGGGNVTIANATPSIVGGSVDFNSTTGARISGSFAVGTRSTNSSLQVNTIDAGSGNVLLQGGSSINSINVNSANSFAANAFGAVSLGNTGAATISTSAGTDINMYGSLTAPGGILLVAGGNVNSVSAFSPSVNLNASSASANAGIISVVAGAAFTESANNILVTGRSTTGGSIDFSTTSGTIQTRGTGSNAFGRGVNLIAYTNAAGTQGGQVLAPNYSISTDGTLVNGNVVIVAERAGATAMSLGAIDTRASGAGNGTGNITLRTATPFGNIDFSKVTAGSPGFAGTFSFFQIGTIRAGDIATSTLTAQGAAIDITSGRNIQIGSIVNNIDIGQGGNVSIQTNGTSALEINGSGLNYTGTIAADANTAGMDRTISITNLGTTGILVNSLPTQTVNNQGVGGTLILDADNGTLTLPGGTINRNGVGTDWDGGSITLRGTSIVSSGNVLLTANGVGTGSGGSLLIDSTTGFVSVGAGAGQIRGTASGAGGLIEIHSGGGIGVQSAIIASQVILQSSASLFFNSSVSGSTVTLTTTGSATMGGTGSINADVLNINAGTGLVSLFTNANSVNINTNSTVNLNQIVDLHINAGTTGAGNLNITTAANQFFDGNFSAAGYGLAINGNYSISGDGVLSSAGELNVISLTTADQVTLNTDVASLAVGFIGAVTINESNNIALTSAVGSTNLRVNANGNITVNGAISAEKITLLSSGNIDIANDVSATGGPSGGGLLLVAGGNIRTSMTDVDITSGVSGGQGGNIVMVAGANYVDAGMSSIQITGASATGGNIDFDTTDIGSLRTSSVNAGSAGGDLTLVAYNNPSFSNSGRILLPTAFTLTTSGNGASSGNIVIVGSGSGSQILLGDVNTAGGTSGGNVDIASSTLLNPVFITTGSPVYTQGAFFDAVGSSIITTGALTTSGGDLSVSSNGAINLGAIDTSATISGTKGGNVNLGSDDQTGSLTLLTITANGLGSGRGGDVTLDSAGLVVGVINANGGATGSGGSVIATYISNASFNTFDELVSAQGNGGGNGGTIRLRNTGTSGISVLGSNIRVGTGGAIGGTIELDAGTGSSSRFVFINGGANWNVTGSTTNGQILVTGNSIEFNGAATLNAGSTSSSTGAVSLNSSGNNPIHINSHGSNLNLSGGTVTVNDAIDTEGGNLTVNAGTGGFTGTYIFTSDPGSTSGNLNINSAGNVSGVYFDTSSVSSTSAGSININLTSGTGTIDGLSLYAIKDANGSNTVSVSANSSSLLDLGLVYTNGGTVGGNISIVNNGSGGIHVSEANANGTVTKGDVSLSTAGGFDSTTRVVADQLTVNFGTGNATLSTAVNSFNATAPGRMLSINEDDGIDIGTVSLDSLTVNAARLATGNITTTADISVAGNLVLTTGNDGAIALSHNLTGTNLVTLDASENIVQFAGTVSGGLLTVNIGSGNSTIKTNVAQLRTSIVSTSALSIEEANGIQLLDLVGGQQTVTAGMISAGNITTSNDVSLVRLELVNQDSASDIIINNTLEGTSQLVLTVLGNGNITQTAGTLMSSQFIVNVGDGTFAHQGGTAAQIQGTGGFGPSVDFFSNAGNLNVENVGPGALTLLSFAGNSLTAKSNTIEIGGGAGLILTSDANLFANVLNLNNSTIDTTNGVITISAISGGLTVNGGGGSLLNSTKYAPGTPGFPNTSGVVLNSTGGDLTIAGITDIAYDSEFNVGHHDLVISNSADWNSNYNISVTARNLAYQGVGQINANDLIFNSTAHMGTIINTSGNVVLTSNLIFNGLDLAIIANGDINASGITSIQLNSTSTDAGNLYLVAGYNATPASGGQIQTSLPYTLGTAPTGSVNLGGVSVNTSATGASGKGGNVVAVASNGSVSLGTVNASSTNGASGDVLVVGQTGVSVGAINVSGGTVGGDVTLSVSAPQVNGTITFTDGTATGGFFSAGTSATAGNISLAGISGADAVLLRTGSGTATQSGGTLIANTLTVDAGLGAVTINSSDLGILSSTSSGQVTLANEIGSLFLANIGGANQKLNVTASGTISTFFSGITVDSLSLTANGASSSINLTQNIEGTTSVTLNAGMDILQSGGTKIRGGALSIGYGNSSFALDTAVDSLTTTSGNGALSIHEDDGIQLLAQGANDIRVETVGLGDITTGAAISTENIILNTISGGGNIVLNHNVTGTTRVELRAGNAGTITQNAGKVAGGILVVEDPNGAVTLNTNVQDLSVQAVSSLVINEDNGIAIAANVSGSITVNSGLLAAGDLTTSGPVVLGAGNLILNAQGAGSSIQLNNSLFTSGNVSLSANAAITQNFGKITGNLLTIGLGGSTNNLRTNVSSFATTGGTFVQITDDNNVIVMGQSANSIDVTSGFNTNGNILTGAAINLSGNLTFRTLGAASDIILSHNVGGGVGTTVLLSSADTIQQVGSVFVSGNILNASFVNGPVSLNTNINQLTTTGGDSLTITDLNGVILNGQAVNNLIVNTAGPISTNTDISIAGQLTFNASGINGNINLNHNINGTIGVTLNAEGAINQVAGKTVSGGALSVGFGTSPVSLTTNVSSLATTTAGYITINEASGIQLNAQLASSLTVNAGLLSAGDITTGAAFTTTNLILNNNTNAGSSIVLSHNVSGTSSASLHASGNITNAVGTTLGAGSLTAISDNGNIGSGINSPLNINATNVTGRALSGDVSLSNSATGNVNVQDNGVANAASGTWSMTAANASATTLSVVNNITAANIRVVSQNGNLTAPGNLLATNTLTLGAANNVSNAAIFGSLTGSNLILSSTNGNIGSADGSVRFNTSIANVEADAFGAVYLTGTNAGGTTINGTTSSAGTTFDAVASQGNLTIASGTTVTGQNLNLGSSLGAIVVTGAVTGSNVDLTAAGNIQGAGLVTGSGSVSLLATNGNIAADGVSTNFNTATGSLTLDANNAFISNAGNAQLAGANFGGTGTLSVTNAGSLDVTALVNANSVTLATTAGGNLTLSANVTGVNAVTLTSAGAIVNNGANLITTANMVFNSVNNIGSPSNHMLVTNLTPLSLTVNTNADWWIDVLSNAVVTLNASSGDDGNLLAVGGVSTSGNTTLTGTLDITTNSINVENDTLTANIINVHAFTGSDLSIDGGLNGGAFTSTVSTTWSTSGSGEISLFGNMTMNGDTFITTGTSGQVTIEEDAEYVGNDAVTITTSSVIQEGEISGDPLTYVLTGGTIANSNGSVTLTGDINFVGHDFAIIASENILFGAATTINLSNGSGDGGNLTMIAGYNFTPATSGQERTVTPYVLDGTYSTSGGSIDMTGVAINLSGSGNGGNLLVVAQGQTGGNAGGVILGTVDTSGTVNGGNITVFGSGDISTGALTTTAGTDSGDIRLILQDSQIFGGTITVTDGTLSGPGNFTSNGSKVGALSFGNILAGDGSFTAVTRSGGSITSNAGISAHDITLMTSALQLTSASALNSNMDSNGDAGNIYVLADSVLTSGPANHLTFIADGTRNGGVIGFELNNTAGASVGSAGTYEFQFNGGAAGNSGSANFTHGGDINLGSNAFIGTSGNNGGSATVISSGNITVAATDVFALQGTAGRGAQIELQAGTDGSGTLALGANTGFFTQANGTGTDGDGGALILTGSNITYAAGGTAATALNLTAHGVGNGDGGTVIFRTVATSQVLIGAPARAARAPFTFVTADASAGQALGSTGDGGTVEITTGGNLTISDTSLVTAARGANGSDGANYTLKAGTAAAGTLIITGDLDASGQGGINGGNITLASNNKTAFSINKSGPKNGITGTLNTGDGEIDVTNLGGGILVQTNAGVVGDEMHFTMGTSKGSFTTGAGVTIDASDELTFEATGGSIGGKALVNINTALLQANTNGKGVVGFNNLFSGAMTLLDSSSGGNFTLRTAGSATLNDIVTGAKGSILVTTGAGNLTVADNATLTANSGALTLQNTNLAGQILIGAGATVATQVRGGNTTLVVGATIPRTGTNPTTTSVGGLNVTVEGRGVVFLGGPPNAVVATTTANVNAINKNVIFSGPAGSIVLGSGSTIIADPPAPTPSAVPVTTITTAAGAPEQSISSMSGLFGFVTENKTVTSDLSVANLNSLVAPGGAMYMPSNLTASSVDEDDSYVVGYMGRGGDIEAAICSDAEIGLNENAPGGALNTGIEKIQHGDHVALKKGNVLFVPFKATTVETPNGTVHIDAKAVALVSSTDAGLAVYDLEDQHKGSISVESNGHNVVLSPGRHVMVTKHHGAEFAQINAVETIAHRNVSSTLKNGHRAHTSEFSLLTALDTVKPLKALTMSKHAHAKQITDRMMKTTAIILQIGGAAGQYQHYFKPRMTAMQK